VANAVVLPELSVGVRVIRTGVRLALLVGIICGGAGIVAAQVKTWQGTMPIPAYEEGPPDPNPPFDTYATTEFNYPYTMRTNLTGVKREHVWRALFLENEYLKCTVLPDVGGHLYTCIDKINGQSMFYANPSIKKAEIGHRGTWAAFGVEYNFPVSHNWVSMSPVDFASATHPDGSASIWIGNIDRVYGMQWGVELILRPGSTLLEERVTLFNRSDVRHRFYWWDNAGVQVWGDSRIQYPMRFAASHFFTDVYRWPVLTPHSKDMSLISNQTEGPVSYFSHATHETFMGVWHPKTQAGMAQFSEYQDLPSKKIWSWGSDAAGLAWQTALSDDLSSYVEVQAGLFRNQETYAFLEPSQTIRFREFWMPVRGTGGISRANKAGVVHMDVHGSELSVSLDVNQRVPGAQISLTQGAAVVWRGTADLTPEALWARSVPLTSHADKLTFELKDREGTSLLKQTDGEYDWDPESIVKLGPQQTFPFPEPGARSEDAWLQLGSDQELNGQVLLAISTYQKAFEKYPESVSLQVAAGRLYASLLRFSEAEPLLKATQARDTPNSLIAYYLGIAEEGLGHTREAETAFEIAYRQAPFRAQAAGRLAGLKGRQGKLRDAYLFTMAAVDAEPLDREAQEQLEALTRALGNTAEADRLARVYLAAEPTSDFLKNEIGTPDLLHLAADPYRVLQVATEYMQLGLYKNAVTLLETKYPAVPPDQTEPGSVLPQAHPLVLYYAALCRTKLGLEAHQTWKVASQLSPSLVFPSSQMDELTLEAALTESDEDANAHYLLGTLLFSKGLYDEGILHWTKAKQLSPRLPIVDADLGKAWLQLKHDPVRALASFRDGSQIDRDNSEIYVGLDQAMSLTDVPAQQRAAALSLYPQADAAQSRMPANLVYQLALTRAEAGQFQQALSLFQGRFLPREEGGITSDQVLFEVKLMQAEADAQTGHCAAAKTLLKGDPARLGSNGAASQSDVRMAAVALSCGEANLAKQLLTRASGGRAFADIAWVVQAKQALGTDNAVDSREKLRKALPASANLSAENEYTSSHWYAIGELQAALGQPVQARESFRKALLLPDTLMSHHLARAALAVTSLQH